MIRIKKIILYFCMVALLVSNISISVFASDLNDGVNDGFDRYMGGTNIQGFNSWDITDKKSLFATNIVSFFSSIGMYFRNGSGGNLMDIFTTHLIESDRIENADNLDEYIASHLTANNDETELYMSNDLTNALHETAVQYINEETGYFVIPTLSTNELIASSFYNKDTLDAFKKYINDSGSDIVFVNGGLTSSGAPSGFKPYKSYDGSLTIASECAYIFLRVPHDWGIVNSGGVKYTTYNEPYIINSSLYDSSWNAFTSLTEKKYDFISVNASVPYFNTCYQYDLSDSTAETNYYITNNDGMKILSTYTYFTKDIHSTRIFTADGRDIRIYKTLEDFKNYSVGTRPYYITDAFNNYDSTVDNSTTITQTEIDNSVTYGDVYNYITNNYDNPDGLSEDELRAILAEYLSQINNNNSGGGSGGSGDSGGSGGGLGGFLDGLGSIGNAIMAILGKLMEILGSAIELVTGAITDLITIIPNSIGELLGALFPVFPEEWIKAITLSLVLGVVVGIVRMFK